MALKDAAEAIIACAFIFVIAAGLTLAAVDATERTARMSTRGCGL